MTEPIPSHPAAAASASRTSEPSSIRAERAAGTPLARSDGWPGPPVPGAWLRALVLALIILAWLAVLVVGAWLLGHLTRTLLLVVLSAVLAFAFTPIASWLERWMPRPLAIGVAYVLGVGIVLGFGAYVVATTAAQLVSLVENLPTYARQAQALQPRLEGIFVRLGIPAGAVASLQTQTVAQVQGVGASVARDLVSRVAQVFGTLIDLVLVLILSVYLAANGAGIAHWLKTETPSGTPRYRAQLLVGVVSRVVGGYIRGVLLLAALIGVLVGAGLAVLGVPYPVLLGVLAFFMEFVPVLGVFISGAAALLIAAIHFQDLLRPLLVLAYFVVIHVIEGDVVGPRIMGKAVGIHPATGLIALVAGTELFGVWGALFAAPIAGLLQAIATAAWLEFRGGNPREVLEAVTEQTGEQLERKVESA